MVHQEDTPQGGPKHHRKQGRLMVRCTADGVEQLNDLIEDVETALAREDDKPQEERLGGEVIISFGGSRVDAENPKDGISAATIEVDMSWEWSHS